MSAAIQVENLSKKYIISHRREERYKTLRDSIANRSKAAFQRMTAPFTGQPIIGTGGRDDLEEFWALKDIDFEVKHGERIGIIGHNGAGKSTLLKLMSRITYPTTGRISIRGRAASLLEIGTGFHQELTGRENIFLNGSIMGMTRDEIKSKFDAIVDFAEVEKFLDTPVKRYSSGMYVRLAFAVAAHLDPDILMVDEVLAVGDIEFQAKCLGKMENISEEGRTIIFVSHNLAAVSRICQNGIWLKHGKCVEQGSIEKIITDYRHSILGGGGATADLGEPVGPLKISSLHFTDERGIPTDFIRSGDAIGVTFSYEVDEDGVSAEFYFTVHNEDQVVLFTLSSKHARGLMKLKRGKGTMTCFIPKLPLLSGSYQKSFSCYANGDVSHKKLFYGELFVGEGEFFQTRIAPKKKIGVMLVDQRWKHVPGG